MEDLLTVINGYKGIVGEIADTAATRDYIAEQFRVLLRTPAFEDAQSGYLLPDPVSRERLPTLKDRIKIKQIAVAFR